MVVWVGESATLPVNCELEVSVRELEPSVAVMVTEVASAACQFNVTLCPALIAPMLAENTRVGLLRPESPVQAQNPQKITGIVAEIIQRDIFGIIRCMRNLWYAYKRAEVRCRTNGWKLATLNPVEVD